MPLKRMCVICKQVIEAERSEAIPETRLCLAHSKEIEAYGGEFEPMTIPQQTSPDKPHRIQKLYNYEGVNRLCEDYLKKCMEPEADPASE